jgi:hypothetical protein
MHYIHAILVEIEEDIDPEKKYSEEEIKELEVVARRIAMSSTEEYGEGHVYDWRTDEDAGRWKEEYPGNGVVLGVYDPERMIELLSQFSNMPLESAKESLLHASYSNTGWRSKLELAEDPSIEIIKNNNNGSVNRDGISAYWSGIKNETPQIDEAFLIKLWSSSMDYMYAYSLTKAIKAVSGEYMTDSGFYSVPDGSSKLSASIKEAAIQNPEKYALVFSDYHN